MNYKIIEGYNQNNKMIKWRDIIAQPGIINPIQTRYQIKLMQRRHFTDKNDWFL